MLTTGLLHDKRMALHDTGAHHPERPARLDAVLDALAAARVELFPVEIVPAARADLLRVHSAEHVDTIEQVCATDGIYPCPDTAMGRASWEAALLAAGAGISACRAVLSGTIDNAFCLVRPPGHHATRNRARGFCLFNNVSVTARWLRATEKARRIAIVDWDVHHGNGTQEAFYNDETVYYAGLHQYPHYPGTGRPDERGAGNTNLNVPMAPGSSPDAWTGALNERIMPELERFKPEFVLISAGFDAHCLEPLADQCLESDTFADLTRPLKRLADGRIVSLLEGGYHLRALGESAVAHIRALQEDGE